MTPSIRGHLVLCMLVVCAGGVAGCGKKGPPLPPVARVPASPGTPQAVRVGDEVYVSFTVPATNASGQAPADVDAVDLYAFTGPTAPPGPDPTEYATRVATYPVVPLLPPLPEGQVAPPPSAFVQGATAVVRETLTPETRIPTPVTTAVPVAPVETPVPPGPLVAPSEATALKRFYLLVARGSRGRASPPTSSVAVPLLEPSGPPTNLSIAYTETAMTVRWAAPSDARVAPAPATDATLLASRPLVPAPPATTYHVFEAARAAPSADPFALALPRPLTEKPVAVTEAEIPGPPAFGVERCFVVRAVDTIGGIVAVGRASEPGCVTPRDTFPPATPQRLEAIAGVGVITLIWEPNTDADLAGYLVLRGAAPGGTLQALTPAPIRETTYRDQTVRPGERYVYAVVAVDTATPQNVSGQSNRVEESSREPR